MKDIALLTEKRYLYPAENNRYINNIIKEDALVQAGLERLNIVCERRAWDDNLSLSDFRFVLFRTTWNYFEQLGPFKKFLMSCKKTTTLINDYNQIIWNLDKRYLLELKNAGINIPETQLVKRGSEVDFIEICESLGWPEVVIKPCVSAAAWNTHYIKTVNIKSKCLFDNLVKKNDMLIQVFQKNIIKYGELSMMMINGKYSHSVLKRAKTGDFRVQDDFGGTVSLYNPKDVEVKFAEDVIKKLPFQPVYARVDVVLDNNDLLALSELELIEPEMWFRLKRGSAKKLAETIFNKYFI